MEMMPISNIKVNSKYLRVNSDIEDLKKSIEKIGVINPLTVNENNELLAGGRRFSALKELGHKEVPVHIVKRSTLEQELISIDENLVRRPLNKIEFETSLNRGREIYEELNPDAIKVEVKVEDHLTPDEKRQLKEEEDADTTSFAAVTSEKTGLSKSVIKSAIKRDALASEKVKEARSNGRINASQTNEIIKLSKEEQDKILPYISEQSVKNVRKLVEIAKNDGMEFAISESTQIDTMPKEFSQLKNFSGKLNKIVSKIIIEEMQYHGEESEKILRQVKDLKNNLIELLSYHGEEDVQLSDIVVSNSMNSNGNVEDLTF